ncbi:hypothetical protein IQ06DRAFT_293010 [Phaeosphaeriaceae sp. SRC1lsM3a]|nr:hypothetical protein IQ06DRAFT_293010 [Stagonospora sp. SRC1lsM3a]
MGHFSRDCPKPRDYSKVQCSNCQQFGHTVKRCKEPIAEGDAMGDGGAVCGGDGGWGNTDDTGAASGGGEASWGGDSGGGGW